MTGSVAPHRAAGRWLVAGSVLLILAAGLAVAWIPASRPARADRVHTELQGVIAGHREAEAVALARTGLGRIRKTHGSGSVQAADAMDSLVRAVTASGNRADLPEALDAAGESARIREASCGGECPALAETLATYEALLWRFEDYRAALPVAERVLAIHLRTSGPRSPEAARSLYLLAEVHRALGNYAVAEVLHRRAISLWNTAPGFHALDIANSLHYLGMLRWTMGDFGAARDLIGRALAAREGAVGHEDEQVAADFNTLGSLAERMGDRAAAMSLFEEGRSIWERTLGKDHPHVARSIANQARLLAASGDDAAARDLFRRALEIRLRAFGPDHHLVARSLADLGRLALGRRDYAEAERCFGRALEILRKDTEAGRTELASTLIDTAGLALATGDTERAMSLALQGEATARDDFLRTSRGLGEEDALRYETVRSTGLDVALSALASDAAGGAPGLAGAAARVWDEMIRSRAMVLDGMVSRLREAPAVTLERPGLAEVARRLPASAALVGFVRYAGPGDSHGGSSASYLALVLFPDGRPPVVVPMGGARRIEAAIRAWQREVGADPRLAPGRQGDGRYLEAGTRLRRAIWDPLAPLLKDRRMVFVVPDGAVNLVSFAALPEDHGRYLIESGPSIQYLSAERDLAARHPPPSPGAGLLAVGDPDFDDLPGPSTAAGGWPGSSAPTCRLFQERRFEPLPGSRAEVDDIESLWKRVGGVLKLTGRGASEGAVKRGAPGRRILHLATHGYFLQDGCASSLSGDLPPDGGVKVGENPLRLSGLALAGANRRAEATGGEEDGILTAEEIGALDLSGTEWVVLSACETGLGQVLEGEGVLGLRRAFHVAGTATLIMTLWPVDDGAARIWMHDLYAGRLEGRSTVEAVRQASLRMLASQRKAGASTHPYFWGAFVAAGDWR